MCKCCDSIACRPEDMKARRRDARECPVAPGYRVSRREWAQLFAVAGGAMMASCRSSGGMSSAPSSRDYGQRLAVLLSLQKESRQHDRLRDPNRPPARLASHTSPKTWKNQYLQVFGGNGRYKFTSDFGWRPLESRNDFHSGIDVKASAGTPVLAARDGIVIFCRAAGEKGGIVIYNNDGTQYTYFHVEPLRRLDVGDRVGKGQRLGTLANWGDNTHLHFALHITGYRQDPNLRNDNTAIDPLYVISRIGTV